MIIKLKKEGAMWALFRNGEQFKGWLNQQDAVANFIMSCRAAAYFATKAGD